MTLEWVKTLGPILISWPLVILVAVLLFRKPLLAFFEGFTWQDVKRAKVGSGGLEIERAVKNVETRQDRQEQEINAIKIALKGILTKHESGPLQGLKKPEFMMRWEPDLYRYLHRLDGLNFIQPKEGVQGGLYAIEKEHEKEERHMDYDKRPQWDLKQYVYITEEGRTYLKTLKELGIELPKV
jgi:hypothetical protein